MLDIYSAINAGGVGRYGASDAHNGGAPGTVADKVNNQMAGHRQKALALIGQGGGAIVGEPMAYYDDGGMSVETRQPAFSPDAQSRPVGDARSTVEANAPRNTAEAVTAMAGGNMPATVPFVSPFVDPAAQAAGNQAGGSLSDEVAAYEQTPEYAARFPGRQHPAAAPQTTALPAEFQRSQQLANASGGIMSALNGGTPASEAQIAQARAAGEVPQPGATTGRAVSIRVFTKSCRTTSPLRK